MPSLSGAQSKEAKALRAQLFEEFVQANEDWNASTMVINSRTTQSEKKRGVYKLMSEEVSQLHYSLLAGLCLTNFSFSSLLILVLLNYHLYLAMLRISWRSIAATRTWWRASSRTKKSWGCGNATLTTKSKRCTIAGMQRQQSETILMRQARKLPQKGAFPLKMRSRCCHVPSCWLSSVTCLFNLVVSNGLIYFLDEARRICVANRFWCSGRRQWWPARGPEKNQTQASPQTQYWK